MKIIVKIKVQIYESHAIEKRNKVYYICKKTLKSHKIHFISVFVILTLF